MDGPSSPNDSKRPTTMTKQLDLKLRCPIRAHADKCVDDGEEVGLPICRKDQTFKAIDKLNEHLSRVHSHKYLCLRCKKKFPLVSKIDLESLKEKHGSCQEKPWPEKKKQWAEWTLMSKEQYDGWAGTAWTTTANERRPPEDGQREKKAFWSWRKIYESLYPNTTDFPAAAFAVEQNDPGQATLMDKEMSLDTRPREKAQQAPATNTGVPSKPPTGHVQLWLMNPLSADLRVGQQRCLEPEVGVSLLETSTGPGSMAYSSTSGTADNLMPPTPSFTSLINDSWDDWLLSNNDSHLNLGERVEDIIDGNPQDYFSREDQNFPEVGDEQDF
ncbi:hypothetical protein NCS55_00507700 [Fusarium keratoplasticum]|nr:hypothetical protein NCS55_00507700 [Fusarium keratoplasticum]